jgi:protein-tyrosine phosphatase
MIDYHCHILPGLDDGSPSLNESLKMAKKLVSEGFREVYCTPHCMKGVYDTTPQAVHDGVRELQQAVDGAGIALKLHPGMEYYLDEYFPAHLEDPVPLGKTGMLLVEAPSQVNPEMVRENLFLAVRKGFTPLFAHPERYDFLAPSEGGEGFFCKVKRYFSGNDGRDASNGTSVLRAQQSTLQALKELGCLFQGNLGSFTGQYGSEVKRRAEILEARGHYHCFGTDAHNSRFLQERLGKEIPIKNEDSSGEKQNFKVARG